MEFLNYYKEKIYKEKSSFLEILENLFFHVCAVGAEVETLVPFNSSTCNWTKRFFFLRIAS